MYILALLDEEQKFIINLYVLKPKMDKRDRRVQAARTETRTLVSHEEICRHVIGWWRLNELPLK